jgi:hypothetical protein
MLGMRPSRLSTAYTLLGLMAVSSGAAVAVVADRFQAQLLAAERSALERKAAAYGRLLAHQLAPAVAAGEPALAQELFDAIATDGDIESLVLMSGTGATLHSRGTPHGWIEAAREGVDSLSVINLGERFAVIAPVASATAPRGTLIIELSVRELSAARERAHRTAALAGFGTLGLEAFLALCLAWSLDRRAAAARQPAGRVAVAPALAAVQLRRVELPRPAANTNAADSAGADYASGQPLHKRV